MGPKIGLNAHSRNCSYFGNPLSVEPFIGGISLTYGMQFTGDVKHNSTNIHRQSEAITLNIKCELWKPEVDQLNIPLECCAKIFSNDRIVTPHPPREYSVPYWSRDTKCDRCTPPGSLSGPRAVAICILILRVIIWVFNFMFSRIGIRTPRYLIFIER